MDWDTPVTLFLMNLARALPDTFVLRILRQCGTVLRWRRALGVKDTPWDYGFVDYSSPSDALQALRIIPQITILDKTWQACIDKSQQADLDSFDQARKMRADFDEDRETKSDQLRLRMVTELVSSSAFARAVPRLTEVLHSENDDSRTSEHYKYLKEIHHENDVLEQQFREELIAWRAAEARFESERTSLRNFLNGQNRSDRAAFLRTFRPKDASAATWRLFLRFQGERRALRTQEESLEGLVRHSLEHSGQPSELLP
jgi:RNA recognition motif-containing protein